MRGLRERPTSLVESTRFEHTAELLGGERVLRRKLDNAIDAHELLREGLPGRAVVHLAASLVHLGKSGAFERAIGMSLRTLQRRQTNPVSRLSQEQSGRIWKFAQVLAQATAVLGSREAAERWLERPAMGLDRRRPIDLLTSPAGLEVVEAFLTRLEYGVYT
jgi:putative toxin-antitoxin system antitoxin component (TIGR02293 family)